MTRVVKLGGRVQGDPALGALLAAAPGIRTGGLVVVHGGGDEVSTLMRALGHEPRFVGGRRVTGDAEIDLVRMVLSGSANKRLVSLLSGAGLRAVGVSGEDGGLLQAHVAPGAPLGRVGERITAHPALLRDLLAAGWVPVVSPLGRDADDPGARALNLNGDDAAAALAAGLGARELLLVADVPGVLVDGAPVPQLTHAAARGLIASGVAGGGMAAKIEAAQAALAGGVHRVRIGTLAALHDNDHGTVLLPPDMPAPSA